MLMTIRGLSKKYEGRMAVHPLDITLREGRVYGLLGPNGAGKSTVMNMAAGYLLPSEGEIEIDGISMTKERVKAQKKVGYLPEIPPLYPEMKVEEYLRFCARLKGIRRRDCPAYLKEVYNLINLQPVSERLIGTLSKGWRQRIGIAQALIGFPPVILLDEPSVGLDPEQILEIRQLIRLLRQRKHIVLLSSHILSEIQEVCDWILVMNHGQLVKNQELEALKKELTGNPGLYLHTDAEEKRAREILSKIKEVKGIAVTGRDEGLTCLYLEAEDSLRLRREIFLAFVQAGAVILEMKCREESLEDAYLRLLGQKGEERRRA